MHPPPSLIVLWVAWLVQAILSVLVVRNFARRFHRKRRAKFDAYRPPAIVIVPFKGIDVDLPHCVQSLCEQDYPDYRLLFVVESEEDPAYRAIREQLNNYPHRRADLIVAGPAAPNQGQKVHNQLMAIDRIESESRDDHAWVFADSDGVPSGQWLANLVGPLVERNKTGTTTGYRWLVPDTSDRTAIWSCFASVLNSSAACSLGQRQSTYAWGGSMAMHASTARQANLRRRLTGALTDDYPITWMCRDLGLRVYFVPHCLVATSVAMRWSEMINFAHRQHLITRIYAPRLYWLGVGITSLFVCGFTSAVIHSFYWLWHQPMGPAWWWSTGVCSAVFVAHQLRASLRARVVHDAFDDKISRRLGTALRMDRWLTPLWMTLHWALLLRAGIGRTLRWRGIRYRLHGPQSVRRID